VYGRDEIIWYYKSEGPHRISQPPHFPTTKDLKTQGDLFIHHAIRDEVYQAWMLIIANNVYIWRSIEIGDRFFLKSGDAYVLRISRGCVPNWIAAGTLNQLEYTTQISERRMSRRKH
jgi:hypothetical protein